MGLLQLRLLIGATLLWGQCGALPGATLARWPLVQGCFQTPGCRQLCPAVLKDLTVPDQTGPAPAMPSEEGRKEQDPQWHNVPRREVFSELLPAR